MDLRWNVHATFEESAEESRRSALQLMPFGRSTVSIALDEVLVLELTTFHFRACQAEVFRTWQERSFRYARSLVGDFTCDPVDGTRLDSSPIPRFVALVFRPSSTPSFPKIYPRLTSFVEGCGSTSGKRRSFITTPNDYGFNSLQ